LRGGAAAGNIGAPFVRQELGVAIRLEQIETYVLSVIEDRRQDAGARWLSRLLLALSWLYRGVIQTRLFLYRHGVIRHHSLGCQVISIGNLTVGGTGKTPIAEAFARALVKQGRRVAILSRGYKSEAPPFWQKLLHMVRRVDWDPPRVVSDGHSLLLDSASSGDEPFMLASNLPNVVVIVNKNRVKAGRYAVKKYGCDTLLLDDGFQYMALKHRLDLVLVDRTNPFGNRQMLPRGILREPVRNIKRASYLFITKSRTGGEPDLKAELRTLNPTAEIIECRHSAKKLQDVFSRDQYPLEKLRDLPISAISGIAQPKGFEDELVRLGAKLLYHKRFADHHRYSQLEIIEFINKSLERGAQAIVTTEKDAVRFPNIERRDLPMYFLRVEIELLSGVEDFYGCIQRICFK
jgi:tetraacyldisaccharide 4'-kinase